MTIQAGKVHSVFPCPVYIVKRDIDITSREKKEINQLIGAGIKRNTGNFSTENYYIFDTGKLKK